MDGYAHLVGIDWGTERHQVCLISAEQRPQQRQFAHRVEGLAALVAWVVATCGDPATVAVAIHRV